MVGSARWLPAVAAAASIAAMCLAQAPSRAAFPIRWPFGHKPNHEWTQFRNGPENNAVLSGSLETSWRVETGGQISSSPTVVDDVLYVGNNSGRLFALRVGSGRTLWSYRTTNPLMSAPLVYRDLVIVGEGDATSMGSMPSEPIVVGHGPSSLIALDRRTGTVRWKRAVAGSAMPTPAIIDGTLVEHNGSGWVSGFDPQTGKLRFARKLSSVASMTAILPLDRGEFATAGVGTNALWRLNAHDGALVWRTSFPSGISGLGDCPPAADGARVYCNYVAPFPPDRATVVGNKAVQHAFAVDRNSGAIVWDVPLEVGVLPPRNEAAIPVLYDGVLCMGSALAPAMHGIDAQTGRPVWQLKTQGPIKGGAVVVDGVLYFGDYGGYLWAVDARSGAIVGRKFANTKFNVGSPIVVGRTLVIGSDSGAIVAVPLQTVRNARDN